MIPAIMPTCPSRASCARVLALLLAAAGPAHAQCATTWSQGLGAAGVDGRVYASTMWDPDGGGPATPLLVVAGGFAIAGNVVANNIATFDPLTGAWSALGSGTDNIVHAVLALPNGDLIGAGEFTGAGGTSASRVARWNGTAWSPLGAGLDNVALALAAAPTGGFYVGGWFDTAGGAPASFVARWDGAVWSALGAGV